MSLRIRRGTDAERQGLTFDLGEIVWTTDTEQLWVGDGVTQGGVNPASSLAGNNLTFNDETNQLDVTNLNTDSITQGTTNKYFSSLLAQNAAASLFQTGTHTGITFVYDDSQHKINATVTVEGSGTFSLVNDTVPELGGDLGLNNHDITGAGNINTIGHIEATGTLYIGTGLAHNLNLNGYDLVGTGDIQTTGTLWATQGLGGNLVLNSYDITGTGNINIDGLLTISTILATTGLGGDLYLNGHDMSGTGNINITGNITASGDITGTIAGDVTGSLFGNVVGDGDVVLVDTTANKFSTGSLLIDGNVITSSIGVEIGSPTNPSSTTLTFNQVDAASSIIVKNTATNSLGTISKMAFVGYGDSIETPLNLSAGDYLGVISYSAYHATSSQVVPAGLISYRVDPTGSVSSTAADGKIEIITSTNTQTLNYLTFDSNGQLAVNQETAQATVDVNGVLRLAPQSSAPDSPVEGMIAVANREFWNPASKVSGTSYPVYFDGTSWNALF